MPTCHCTKRPSSFAALYKNPIIQNSAIGERTLSDQFNIKSITLLFPSEILCGTPYINIMCMHPISAQTSPLFHRLILTYPIVYKRTPFDHGTMSLACCTPDMCICIETTSQRCHQRTFGSNQVTECIQMAN